MSGTPDADGPEREAPEPDLAVPAEAAPLIEPPEADLITCPPADSRWGVIAETGRLWFEPAPRALPQRVLIVSFDNLATIDEGFPRGPWMWRRLSRLGHAVLGVQSAAKDWFRTDFAPTHLRRLEELGFFKGFDTVLLIGASMGGFAALNFAPLIPDSRVIAFSAQTSMSRVVAPFEARFRWAVRNSNWEEMPFLDAAAAIPYIRQAVLIYDPFTPEDRAHAARMRGPNVQQVRIDHGTHEAVRVVLLSGALPALIADVLATGRAGPAYFRAMRARRKNTKWQRALLADLAARGQHARVIRAADLIEARTPEGDDKTFIRRARRAARNTLAAGGAV